MQEQPVGSALRLLEGLEQMDLHEDTIDELSGDGTIIIGVEEAGAVYYWLTIVPTAGFVVAEGSIIGPEQLMRKVVNATGPKLVLEVGAAGWLRRNAPMRRQHYRYFMGEGSRGLSSDRTMLGSERCPNPELSIEGRAWVRSEAERN